MYVSNIDKLNTGHAWFVARTYQAARPQDWTPQADLYLDYQRYAEGAGIAPSKRLSSPAFAMELRGLMRREPQLRMAKPFNGGPERLLPFWPRVARRARQLAA